MDEATSEILAAELTTNAVGDGQMLPVLLDSVKKSGVLMTQVSGDGWYDSWDCHTAIAGHGAKAAIPARSGSKIKQHGNSKKPPLPRDESLRRIRKIGEPSWKVESGYHRRSLAETAMLRHKQIFGDDLGARLLVSQKAEASLRCVALNRMTALGMPDSYAVVVLQLRGCGAADAAVGAFMT